MVARLLIVIAALGPALAGCKKQSELYCEMHPGDLENCGYLDAGIDARPTCASDPDCTVPAPYCEPNAHVCVECYLPEHCAAMPNRPFCDPETFLCSSCVANTDCASNVCLPNGVCGDDGNVAYVDPAGTDNAQCTATMKCKTVEAALATKKPYVKLEGAISEAVVIDAQAVTLIGEPGATLTRPSNGVVLTVTHGGDVSIFDLTIIGAAEKGISADMNSTLRLTGVTVTGCNQKDKRAIEAKNATLIMSRSTVTANAGGGILVDAMSIYQITNSFIVRNGTDATMVGGLQLAPTSSTFNRLEFNTIADNRATGTTAGGVLCSANIAAPNNLIVRNYAGGHAGLPTDNTGISSCDFAQSIKATEVTDFMFVMPEGAGPWDYHVGAGSMAIDRGVASDITVDVDADTRPQGAKFDVGADEFKL